MKGGRTAESGVVESNEYAASAGTIVLNSFKAYAH